MNQALMLNQLEQLENPDARIVLGDTSAIPRLREFATALSGCSAGDAPHFIRRFWEIPRITRDWELFQTTVNACVPFGGKSEVILWEREQGAMAALAEGVRHLNHAAQNWLRGKPNWGKRGVVISQMRELEATLYTGSRYDNNCVAIVPNDPKDLLPLWAYCASPEYNNEVRKLYQKLNVTPGTLLDVPFDRIKWLRVAEREYPGGLPEPHSDDPTQWLFLGDIPSSADPLHVALARLIGYRWPNQAEGALDRYANEDGIVTLSPLVNRDGITGQLRALLKEAYESEAPARPGSAPESEKPRDWNEAVIPNLLVNASSAETSLEDWVRDKFFAGHCKLFQQCPFIWHIWDGRKDGFHAFVNYHKLDRKNLERLTHVYLGGWIERQKAAVDDGDRTADARLIAAQELQRKLELIRIGEPPYDIFVRWKSLAEQPVGWDPDLNDGVRMNIRPFVEAGILRGRVNVNWNKDRGKDPKPNVSGTVERHNDLHLTLAEKRAARKAVLEKPQ